MWQLRCGLRNKAGEMQRKPTWCLDRKRFRKRTEPKEYQASVITDQAGRPAGLLRLKHNRRSGKEGE